MSLVISSRDTSPSSGKEVAISTGMMEETQDLVSGPMCRY